MPLRPRLHGSQPILVTLLAALVACGAPTPEVSAEPTPWDRPVAGAAAVAAWQDDGEPSSPFGPDGFRFDSPDELVEAVAGGFAEAGGLRTTGAVVERRADGTAIGWVRVEVVEAAGDSAIAMDLRLTIRSDADGWFVARTESREHCARPPEDGACR